MQMSSSDCPILVPVLVSPVNQMKFISETNTNFMMIDWNEYQKQIQQQIAEIGRSNREIVKGYRELTNAGSATNLLGEKVRELIALAVAVTRQCDGCIVTHTDAAIKHGATKEEIIEALSVAVAVNAGAALIFSSRVIDAYNTKTTG
jgi:AhpD family alkylhydroperoxidase